jgi:hypothetical protein
MKKVLLVLFILFDLAVVAGSVFVLYTYLTRDRRGGLKVESMPPATSSVRPSPVKVSTGTVAGATGNHSILGNPPAAPPPVDTGTRHISFSYRSPHAHQVAIRADFTGWKAEPMKRNAAGVWMYTANLTPGEYAYCFSVDDKPPAKDPANKRTKMIGRAVVSAIVVAPLSSAK